MYYKGLPVGGTMMTRESKLVTEKSEAPFYQLYKTLQPVI